MSTPLEGIGKIIDLEKWILKRRIDSNINFEIDSSLGPDVVQEIKEMILSLLFQRGVIASNAHYRIILARADRMISISVWEGSKLLDSLTMFLYDIYRDYKIMGLLDTIGLIKY